MYIQIDTYGGSARTYITVYPIGSQRVNINGENHATIYE